MLLFLIFTVISVILYTMMNRQVSSPRVKQKADARSEKI